MREPTHTPTRALQAIQFEAQLRPLRWPGWAEFLRVYSIADHNRFQPWFRSLLANVSEHATTDGIARKACRYAFAPSSLRASDHTSFDSPRRDSFLRSRPWTTQTALSRRSHRDECHASGSRSARPALHPPIVRYLRASVDVLSRAVWKSIAIPLSHRGSRRSCASSPQVQAKASPRPAQIGHRPDIALYSAAAP